MVRDCSLGKLSTLTAPEEHDPLTMQGDGCSPLMGVLQGKELDTIIGATCCAKLWLYSDLLILRISQTWQCLWQGEELLESRLLDRFQRDMTDMLRRLRAHPAQILWRAYSPSHFGGELGSFILDKAGQGREHEDKVSTHWIRITYIYPDTSNGAE